MHREPPDRSAEETAEMRPVPGDEEVGFCRERAAQDRDVFRRQAGGLGNRQLFRGGRGRQCDRGEQAFKLVGAFGALEHQIAAGFLDREGG